MQEDKWNWKRKKEFYIPVRQVIHSDVFVEAINLTEAIEMVSEMNEADMDYPFDDVSPQIGLDEDDEIIKEYREDLKNRGVLPI